MTNAEYGGRGALVSDSQVWEEGESADLWVSCHGYESRSAQHLELPELSVLRRVSYGFQLPGVDDDGDENGEETDEPKGYQSALIERRRALANAGFDTPVVSEQTFGEELRSQLLGLSNGSRPIRVVADISSMNRSRIASLLLACASRDVRAGCDLDLVYFPSTFSTHKHQYEPLESFGPVHERVAGWPVEPDLPLAVVIGVGTEPRRAEGVVETLEPSILSLFMPTGDDPEYEAELIAENRRVLEVAGEPIEYLVRDPLATYELLSANVARLSERARIVIVPLGPKIFSALAMNVALAIGPQVGVWAATAGQGIEPVDVHGSGPPVVVRMTFRDTR